MRLGTKLPVVTGYLRGRIDVLEHRTKEQESRSRSESFQKCLRGTFGSRRAKGATREEVGLRRVQHWPGARGRSTQGETVPYADGLHTRLPQKAQAVVADPSGRKRTPELADVLEVESRPARASREAVPSVGRANRQEAVKLFAAATVDHAVRRRRITEQADERPGDSKSRPPQEGCKHFAYV